MLWGALGGLAVDQIMQLWRKRKRKAQISVFMPLGGVSKTFDGFKKPKPIFYKDESGKVMENKTDDDEAMLMDIERIYEMIKDDETFEALKTLHDKEYSPDEIYQASLYIAVTESGDHD